MAVVDDRDREQAQPRDGSPARRVEDPQPRSPVLRMMGVMDVELLVVPGCRNEGPAAILLRSALIQAALPSGFRVTVIADEQQAAQRGFTGSPTFLINGSDPFGTPEQPVGLGCRIYRQPDGNVRVLPDLPELRDALAAARDVQRSSQQTSAPPVGEATGTAAAGGARMSPPGGRPSITPTGQDVALGGVRRLASVSVVEALDSASIPSACPHEGCVTSLRPLAAASDPPLSTAKARPGQ